MLKFHYLTSLSSWILRRTKKNNRESLPKQLMLLHDYIFHLVPNTFFFISLIFTEFMDILLFQQILKEHVLSMFC